MTTKIISSIKCCTNKKVTGMLMLYLEETGQCSFDDPVDDYSVLLDCCRSSCTQKTSRTFDSLVRHLFLKRGYTMH